VGSPEECKQRGCVWAQLYKHLDWHWVGRFSPCMHELAKKIVLSPCMAPFSGSEASNHTHPSINQLFTAIVWDDVILAHTECKEMDLCPIRVRKAFLFDKPAPKSNLPCLATSTQWKSCLFSVWVRYLKQIALIGHAE